MSIALLQLIRAPWEVLRGLGRRLVALIDGIDEARDLADRYGTLSRMSNVELANLGLKPEEIAHAVFESRGR